MRQSHGSNLWREPSGSGVIPPAKPEYFIIDGADVELSLVGPAAYQLVDVLQSGSYHLISLTPAYFVASGSDYTISTGPAGAILVDAGGGDITGTVDLAATPIADLAYDAGGNLWLERRTCTRLDAVQVSGDVRLY